jgi:hypothetical protein
MANQFQKPDHNTDLFLRLENFFHKPGRCDISCAVARVQTEMPKVAENLTGGNPSSVDELIHLSALNNSAKGPTKATSSGILRQAH